MRADPKQSWVVAATAFARHAFTSSSTDLSWHAPASTAINDLETALGGSGVNGFIYNNSYPTDVPYGTYNWCNMPHVRKEEYVKPSKEYALKYVEVVSKFSLESVVSSLPVEDSSTSQTYCLCCECVSC